jgi:hypothetical protein
MATAAALLADDEQDQQLLLNHLKQAASKGQDLKQARRVAQRFVTASEAGVEVWF